MNYRPVHFRNIGYLDVEFTDQELKSIKDEIDEIYNDNLSAQEMNSELAGNIEKEFALTKTHKTIENLLLPGCIQFDKIYDYVRHINILTKDGPLVLEKAWVNFQKKHEFNPPHIHTGLFSFVIWIKVPYLMADEMALPNTKKSNSACPGHFEFTFINCLGKTLGHTIPADKTYEGKGVIFPSYLTHSVYPFYTSDDYRISVSGNFKIKNMLGINDLYTLI